MNVLTLSPEERIYAIALVSLASASTATLAGFVQSWRHAPSSSFLPTYAAMIGMVAALAVLLLGIPMPECSSAGHIALSLLAGAIGCVAALGLEALITRALHRRFDNRPIRQLPEDAELIRPDLTHAGGAGSTTVLFWLLVVGAGEEVLFRGILVDLVKLASDNGWVRALLLAATVVAFALTHVQFDFREALRKLPLGIACLAACLVSGTILAPIIAHVGYNAWSWHVASRLRPRHPHAQARAALNRRGR